MTRKPRVLMVSEASYLATGYGTFAREVLTRLQNSGEFEVAELASFGAAADPRRLDVGWPFFPVLPGPGEEDEYRADPANAHGKWKFEAACLAFRPDAVVGYRDPWYDDFLGHSPFRRRFHLVLMPTVDAVPLMDEWLETYRHADALFAYTDWGADVLRGYGFEVLAATPPGADADVFRPLDRAACRRELGVPEDALVVGMTARNQPRKLFGDLVESFAAYLRAAPPRQADRSLLYLHTGYPDLQQSWNLPRLLKDAGVAGKTRLTYACRDCGAVRAAPFSDARAHCPACGAFESRPADSNQGVSRETLAAVLNTFDAYAQIASNEGFGMPMVEAAMCGVPVAAVDYSAMGDVVRKVGGFPVPVQRFVRDPSTHRLLACPDNAAFVAHLVDFLGRPGPVRARAGRKARAGALAHFTYERTAGLWAEHLRGVPPGRWGGPPEPVTPARDVPAGLPDGDFVRWGMCHVAGRPDLADSYTALRLARDLGWGRQTRDGLLQDFLAMADRHNGWERRRAEGGGR